MRKGCRSRASKDFTAGAALWSFPHHTLLQPHLDGREGAPAGLPRAQVHGQLFLVKPDPANYISQAPFPTGFCQGEALREPWEEEGSKSQMIPLPFPAPAPTSDLCFWSPPGTQLLGSRNIPLPPPPVWLRGEEQLAVAAHVYVDSLAHLAFQLFQQLTARSPTNVLWWNWLAQLNQWVPDW